MNTKTLENACEIICKSRLKYGVEMWCVRVGRKNHWPNSGQILQETPTKPTGAQQTEL